MTDPLPVREMPPAATLFWHETESKPFRWDHADYNARSRRKTHAKQVCEKNQARDLTNIFFYAIFNSTVKEPRAGMAELADARDLKSRGSLSRTGSSPVSGTIFFPDVIYKFISRSGAVR